MVISSPCRISRNAVTVVDSECSENRVKVLFLIVSLETSENKVIDPHYVVGPRTAAVLLWTAGMVNSLRPVGDPLVSRVVGISSRQDEDW